MLGHLRPQPQPSVRAAQGAGEEREGGAEGLPSLGEGGTEDLGPAVPQQCGDVPDGRGDGGRPPLPQQPLDLYERVLPLHLGADVGGQQAQVLDALDLHACAARHGDVEVLPDGSQPPLHHAGGAEDGAQALGYLPHLLRVVHVRGGGDLDERDAEPVQAIGDLPVLSINLAGGVLLQAQRCYPNAPAVDLERAVDRHQGSPLEAAGVGTVDHYLAHEMDLVHHLAAEQG